MLKPQPVAACTSACTSQHHPLMHSRPRCSQAQADPLFLFFSYGSLQLHRNYPNKASRHFARAVHIEVRVGKFFWHEQTRDRKSERLRERENGNGHVCKRAVDLRLDIKQPYNVKVVAAYAAVLDDVGMDLAIVERMYIRAVQLEPTYVLALHGLGTVMHRMERLAEAEMYYKMALKIEPTHEGAFENLEILREATYAQQGVTFVTERKMLRSRDRSHLSSRAGRMSPRSGLQSRGSVRVLSFARELSLNA